jgi:hypothetical protein
MFPYQPIGAGIRLCSLVEVGWARPPGIDEFQAIEMAAFHISRNDMKMHIRVDHHQHQVVELVVVECLGQSRFHLIRYFVKLGKAFLAQLGEGVGWLMCSKNEGTQCQLDRTQHDDPILKLMNNCLRCAEFPHRGIQDCRTGGWNADHLEAFKGYSADEARYVDMRRNRPDPGGSTPTTVPVKFPEYHEVMNKSLPPLVLFAG